MRLAVVWHNKRVNRNVASGVAGSITCLNMDINLRNCEGLPSNDSNSSLGMFNTCDMAATLLALLLLGREYSDSFSMAQFSILMFSHKVSPPGHNTYQQLLYPLFSNSTA